MGVLPGISQRLVDLLFELLGNDVFQEIRFLVHLVPGVAQYLGQIQFQQPVVPDDLERDPGSGRSQSDSLVALVFHQLQLGKTLDHVGHAGRPA